jgi:hypothetical protein
MLADASATTFVVTHVRQALQQTAAMGAWSPYLATVSAARPCQICFTSRV